MNLFVIPHTLWFDFFVILEFSPNFSIYDNNVIPPEVIDIAKNTATIRFTGTKKYTAIEVHQAILGLPIDHCQEITRVFIQFYIYFYPYTIPLTLILIHTHRQTHRQTQYIFNEEIFLLKCNQYLMHFDRLIIHQMMI